MVTLTVYRYGGPIEFKHGTVQAACAQAEADLEHDQAFPSKVVEDGITLWEYDGDIDSLKWIRERAMSETEA